MIRQGLAVFVLAFSLTMSAKADLIYQNYTPGATDYDAGSDHNLSNFDPVYEYSGGFEAPGSIKELRFTMTSAVSAMPEWVYAPYHIISATTLSHVSLVVRITELNGDGRTWSAAASPGPELTNGDTGDKKIYFSSGPSTPPMRQGYQYLVVVKTNAMLADGYLSNTASNSAEYYSATTSVFSPTPTSESTSPLVAEPAVALYGEQVPEPASLTLVMMGGWAILRCRRR